MARMHSWEWVETQVARSMEAWRRCPSQSELPGPAFTPKEQRKREEAYDAALREVEREVKRPPRTRAGRLAAQDRITESFARFSAAALGLEAKAIDLLTLGFLPVGRRFAQWARQFDSGLSMSDIVQACRNTWTACGLQPLLGDALALTPSIVGYSLLYPYTDNYLDCEDVTAREKACFNERFRFRLRGHWGPARNRREYAVWSMVSLIEQQYPRSSFPEVYDCLLAIHRAQEESVSQLKNSGEGSQIDELSISCAKGGTSVLADACLSHGWLGEEEAIFAFDWGVLLQLGDDLQDVREDLKRGSVTLFTRAAMAGEPLDGLATQLLNRSEQVSDRMDRLPHGSRVLKELLRMSWHSLILMAIADSQKYFSRGFLARAESHSPFRFGFLRARRDRLSGRRGLYARLFDAFLEPREEPGPARRTPEGDRAGTFSSLAVSN